MLKDFCDSVLERGFFHQSTDEKGIKNLLSKKKKLQVILDLIVPLTVFMLVHFYQ